MKEQMRADFEAIMRERSTSELKINRFGNYQNTTIQTKWKYFEYGYQAALSAVPANHKLTQAVNALAAQTGESAESITEWLCDKGGLTQLMLSHFGGKAQQPVQEPVKQDRWISIEERLPEVKVEGMEFFLVTTINLQTQKRSVFEAAFLNEMELCSDYSDPKPFSGWHSAKESNDYDGWYEPLGNEYCKVTHWMPLPLPPVKEVTE